MENNNKPMEKIIGKEKSEEQKKVSYRFPLNNKRKYDSAITSEIPEACKSNLIRTSKYTVINALPKILFEQFSLIGNIYFLILAILQMNPYVSQSGGSPFILIPLIVVVGVNGIKDFFEDYKRKKSDERENFANANLISSNEIKITQWKDLQPGDIVKVNKNEYFPADLLAIYSTNKNGSIFVETKNLDGETNLKYKECVSEIYNIYIKNKDENINNISNNLSCYIDCHEPYPNLYEFEGIIYKGEDLNQIMNNDINIKGFINERHYKSLPLEANNLLLRGSSLKNTEFIIGIVIYTGHSSKIMLNSPSARSKTSKLTQRMNFVLLLVIIAQMLICIIFAIIQFCIYNKYKPITQIERSNIFFNFLCWILAINNLVPISLLVSMELIRFIQGYFMGYDAEMYDHSNRRFAIIQSSGLNEELGQVNYIFSDKTGTLTKNVMQFKQMVIGHKTYGSDIHANKEELKEKDITNCDFYDPNFFKDMNGDDLQIKDDIQKYVFSLALCHTIITENNNNKINYLASSPDELALVNAAKLFGVELLERSSDSTITLKYNEKLLKYKLLHVLEFNSDRKRMSVIIKNMNDNTIKLITKGADSSISPRLNKSSYNNLKYTLSQLDNFGRKGLRTLLIASKIISENEFNEFIENYQSIIVIQNSKNKGEQLDELYNKFESNFDLLGATAIEDCLQDNVAETLSSFAEIGIKIFMLTGDHPLTAISIAHSSGLISDDITPIIIDTNDDKEINKGLLQCLDLSKKMKTCLVMTGNALIEVSLHINQHDSIANAFKMALESTHSVICSRVSPKQKAEIVTFVKELDPSKTTLSIGDGANDVNMINVADIGIGIFGNEGIQAARASDYAIGQFCYLKRLLYVHGREAYRKNSFAVCYILWKNFLYATPIILFAFYSRFSSQMFYDPALDAFYNILFTAYPVGWYAATDKEAPYDYLEKHPYEYRKGMNNKLFTPYIIFRWYGYGLLAGALILVVHYNVLCYTFISINYNGYDMWTIGSSIFTCIVFVVNFKLIFETHTHTIYTAFLITFSIGTFIIFFLVGNYCFTSWKIYAVLPKLVCSADFWLMLFLTILSYAVIEYGWRAVWYYFKLVKAKAKRIKLKAKLMDKEKKLKQEKLTKSALIEEIENPEIKEKGFTIDLLDTNYTGYAFSEDVANVGLIKEDISNNRNKSI